jgi:hypothetical protein
MAEAELDVDDLILALRSDPEAMRDMMARDLAEGQGAFEKEVRDSLLPLMRVVYAYGVAAERVRCTRWLIAMGDEAITTGWTPTLSSLARELLEATPEAKR